MTTLNEVTRIIARVAHCNPDEISPDTALKDIKVDSLHWVRIIVGVENAFNVEIDIDKMQEFATMKAAPSIPELLYYLRLVLTSGVIDCLPISSRSNLHKTRF